MNDLYSKIIMKYLFKYIRRYMNIIVCNKFCYSKITSSVPGYFGRFKL